MIRMHLVFAVNLIILTCGIGIFDLDGDFIILTTEQWTESDKCSGPNSEVITQRYLICEPQPGENFYSRYECAADGGLTETFFEDDRCTKAAEKASKQYSYNTCYQANRPHSSLKILECSHNFD